MAVSATTQTAICGTRGQLVVRPDICTCRRARGVRVIQVAGRTRPERRGRGRPESVVLVATLGSWRGRFLAYSSPSCSPDPQYLAVLTRSGFVRVAYTFTGISRVIRLVPASNRPAVTRRRQWSHLHLNSECPTARTPETQMPRPERAGHLGSVRTPDLGLTATARRQRRPGCGP